MGIAETATTEKSNQSRTKSTGASSLNGCGCKIYLTQRCLQDEEEAQHTFFFKDANTNATEGGAQARGGQGRVENEKGTSAGGVQPNAGGSETFAAPEGGGEAPASRGAGRATASLVRKFDQDYDDDESGSEVDNGDESEAEGLSEGLVREQGTVNKPLAHKVPGENVLVI